MNTHRLVLLIVALCFGMLACNLETAAPNGSTDPTQVYLSAGQTIAAIQTEAMIHTLAAMQSGGSTPGGNPPAGDTPQADPGALVPSDTPFVPPAATWTNTVMPTNTPTITLTPIPCNWAKFIADVNVPDNWTTTTHDHFTKTWRLQNIGSCTWTSGYKLKFDHGDQMGAPAEQSLTAGTVAPGQTVDVSVNLLSPGSEGTYQGWYRIYTPANEMIPFSNSVNHWFWLKVIVDNPAPSASVAIVNNSVNISPGANGSVTADCPAGSLVVSGGFNTAFNVRPWNHGKALNGWKAYAHNYAAEEKSLTVYAVCLTLAGASVSQTGGSTNLSPNSIGMAEAVCPAGTVVTGGGFASIFNKEHIYTSMKWGNGWRVWAKETAGSGDATLTAYAECLSAAGTSTSDVSADISIPAGNTGGGKIGCSAGKLMVGGGFSGGTISYYAYVSAPFSGSEWQAYGYNTDMAAKTLKVYAVCLTLP